MKKVLGFAAVATVFLLVATSADATCNAVCQQRCWQHQPDTHDTCVSQWSYINVKFGKDAWKFHGAVGPSTDVRTLRLPK